MKFRTVLGMIILVAIGLKSASSEELIGTTLYDYQCNGSTGHRIAVDSSGGVHVVWMKSTYTLTNRSVYYNYRSPSMGWVYGNEGRQASYRNRDGYPQIALMPDGRDVVVYHNPSPSGSESLYCAINSNPLNLSFDYFRPSNSFGGRRFMWPYVAVDRESRIHIVAMEIGQYSNFPALIGYTRSTDAGESWTNLAVVDTLLAISPMITSSAVSNKVAIVYPHPTDMNSQWKNDIYVVESENGVDWDFVNDKINLTHYGQDGDSLFAYVDLDAVYDYNDNLHIIWNAQNVGENRVYFDSQLLHYDQSSGTINQIYQFGANWPDSGCGFGIYNWSISKMSLGVDSLNHLFTVYTSWNSGDCSIGGFANGDLFMQYSSNNGQSWSAQTNLTRTSTLGCVPGDCDSDVWPSMAEHVDSFLHIIYINDKDAGGFPQTEGALTDNLVMYLAQPNPILGYLYQCNYEVGDINNDSTFNGLDINYGVLYLKGGPNPPYICECPRWESWYLAGDVNGDCRFSGIDITYMVGFLKGGAALTPCPTCPPIR
jgi:hypothetical protein